MSGMLIEKAKKRGAGQVKAAARLIARGHAPGPLHIRGSEVRIGGSCEARTRIVDPARPPHPRRG
jgi:hypothetical protein